MARESYSLLQIPESTEQIPHPDWRAIANGMLKHGSEMFFGTMTGTGAALDSPTLPFDPAMVLVYNLTDVSVHIKLPSQAGAVSLAIKAAVSATAANGITLGVKKFTLGTDADLNAAADVLHFVAIGSRDIGGSS
jgi:hypothetical protein